MKSKILKTNIIAIQMRLIISQSINYQKMLFGGKNRINGH